ncbi:MAG: TetR/AcrR family transcriptional repressor of mexJK operon [Alteromonadaceae bacterium]|jgi:TetR/AcrR family transcriptional repressor of mexJK operon
MNKPRSKSEEKRKLIIEAATELFTELGFNQTSMDKIAKKAGVSKQTVYSHFGNKDELFVDSISRKCISYNLFGLVNDKLDDPLQALTALGLSFIDMLLSDDVAATHRTCIAESETYPNISQLFYSAGPERTITEIATCMAEFNKRGLLKIADSRFATVQFLCMVKGEASIQSDLNVEKRLSRTEVTAYVHSCVTMFLRGYAV